MSQERKDAVLRVKDAKTIRRMLMALSSDLKDYKRDKGYSTQRSITELQDRLVVMRQAQRDRSGDNLLSPRSFAKKTEKDIKEQFNKLVGRRKFYANIIVGGADTGNCEYKKGFPSNRPGTVTFCLGHMWLRNVYGNFYKGYQLTSDDYIILSAVEYRTNVQNIRLFEAAAYGIKEKGKVKGWIGQSKLGDQSCAFRTDKQVAIQAAQKLTLKSVNAQITGETK